MIRKLQSCAGASSLPVMPCCMATASSDILHSAVNHLSRSPLNPGASLFLPTLRTWNLVFSGSSGENTTLLHQSCQECRAGVPDMQLCSPSTTCFMLFLNNKQCQNRHPRRNAPGKCDTDEHEWRGRLLKTLLYKKRTTSCSSATDKWDWKNRSRTAEVCPSLWETMSNWRIIP